MILKTTTYLKSLLLVLLVFIAVTDSVAQTWEQVGGDMDGEAAVDRFGFSVSLSNNGSTIAVGGWGNDAGGADAGHVRVFEDVAGTWMQIGNDIDGVGAGDESGRSVSISGNGNVVAVGAPFNATEGQVRVYENNGGSWQQIGLDIEGEDSFDQSGYSVSLNDSGTILAIGAPFNDVSGHVRVYENNGGTWQLIGADIDGEFAGDQAGFSVSLNSTGDTVAIGSLVNNGVNGSDSGSVRVFRNIAGNWQQLGADLDGEVADDEFGRSVALSNDGNTLAASSIENNGGGVLRGHTRVFEFIAGSWNQLGSDLDGEGNVDLSGYSVSLSGDGSKVAIGAINNDGVTGSNSGHARVYEWQSPNWVQLGLDIDGEAAGDSSGISVSFSDDGLKLAVGARLNDGTATSAGHARVYEFTTTVNTPPSAQCVSYTAELDDTGNITISASDIDNGSSDVEGNVTLAISENSFDCDDIGDNNVTLTVTDADGATATCVAVVSVQDNLGPVPSLGSLPNVTAQCEVTSVVAPTALDNCSGTITGESSVIFPITSQGTIIITWSYEDDNGNISTQIQSVIIEDTLDPVPSISSLPNVTAECEVNSVAAPTAVDNCSGTLTGMGNVTFPITDQGTTVITWTYEDANENVITQIQSVIIEDTLDPEVTCPSNETVLVPLGEFYTVPDYVAAGDVTASDNCGISSITQNPSAGSLQAAGTFTVSFTAEDEGENISECSFEVTVDEILSVNAENLSVLSIFPNPTTNSISIFNPSNIQLSAMIVYDLRGSIVLKKEKDLSNVINLTTLEAGSYFVRLESKDRHIVLQLIKN